MELIGDDALGEDSELLERFDSFARKELERWSPEPPGLSDLHRLAAKYNLDDLADLLEEALDESRQRDEEAGKEVDARPRASISNTRDAGDSDVEIGRLFARLRTR